MSSVPDDELRVFIDRQAIQAVIFRYSDAVTRGDYAQVRTVFAPDAIWESPLLDMRFDTADAFIDQLIERSKSLDVLIQTPHSPVIELVGADRASATTTIQEIFRGTLAEDGPYGKEGTEINVDQFGIYHDELAKVDGRWVFTHRRFAPFLIATGTVAGDVVGTPPLLPPA